MLVSAKNGVIEDQGNYNNNAVSSDLWTQNDSVCFFVLYFKCYIAT